jgi:beta-N-acetylhexosaminidase
MVWADFYRDNKSAAARLAASYTDEQRISQLFLVNLGGNSYFRLREQDSSGRPAIPGGYLFFRGNIAATADGTAAFTKSIRDFCESRGLVPPYLAIDHEGGVVNRLRGILDLESAQWVAANMGVAEAEKLYASQGAGLKRLGFHLNLAPVAESATAVNRDFLGDRSFGGVRQAAAYSRAAVRGYRRGGVHCAVKHFPGTGGADPHTGLSDLNAGAKEMEEVYLAPFRALLAGKDAPPAVLMAHTRTAADPGVPACLSAHWVEKVLRGDMGFSGLVISDDIYMKALADNGYPPDKAAVAAIEAGVDVIMISAQTFLPAVTVIAQKAVRDPAFAAKVDAAVTRVLVFKMYVGLL